MDVIRKLKAEYKASNPAWVIGLKLMDNGLFKALVEYPIASTSHESGVRLKKEMVDVTEDWIIKEYGGDMPNYVQVVRDRRRLEGNFFPIPAHLQDRQILVESKIRGVRYVPERSIDTVDRKALNEERATVLKEADSTVASLKTTQESRDLVRGNALREHKSRGKPVLRKKIGGYFVVDYGTGHKNIRKPEDELIEILGKTFVDEVKLCRNKMCNVPVGDSRESTLHLHPKLVVEGAPIIHYRQSANELLCVHKSLASVLHNLGWIREAAYLATEGRKISGRGCGIELAHCRDVTQEQLPKWVKAKRQASYFNWETDLQGYDFFVGVLLATDGSNSHAVSIHGGYIYDANEERGIPLCKEGLDYCTCTSTDTTSEFESFTAGWIFCYEGKDDMKRKIMSGERGKTGEQIE